MLVLSSCDPTKRAVRHINKAKVLAPELFVDHRDTIRDTVFTPLEAFSDTLIVTEYDTIQIEKERLKIRLINLGGDTVYLDAKCLGDTVYLDRVIEVPVIQNPPKTEEGKTNKTFLDRIEGILLIVLAIVIAAGLGRLLSSKR